jgi:hypothetical protein
MLETLTGVTTQDSTTDQMALLANKFKAFCNFYLEWAQYIIITLSFDTEMPKMKIA